jgi:hypothetical protein
MKLPYLNPYYRAALLLIVTAAILVAVAALTGRNDLTSAALVLAALICLFVGIFLSLLSTGEPVDSRYTSLLAIPGCISVCRVCADLGIQGNACIIPKGMNGMTSTMQFIPVAEYDGSPVPVDTFVATATAAGLLTQPSGYFLLRKIQDDDQLTIPSDIPAIADLLQEVSVEVMELADRLTVSENGSLITVTMVGYRLIPGCRAMAAESPKCCTTHPCPVSSLFACLIAEGTGRIVQMERCDVTGKEGSITGVYSLLP